MRSLLGAVGQIAEWGEFDVVWSGFHCRHSCYCRS